MKYLLILIFTFLLSACGSDSSEKVITNGEQGSDNTLLAIPNNTQNNEYKILFMGNSHVRSNNLSELVETLILAGTINKTVFTQLADGMKFLDERLLDGKTNGALIDSQWSHIILQGQKYSTSGAFDYPIVASTTWIKRSKIQNATPIMFPEHPRKGDFTEGKTIHELHLKIAEQERACVAPIGLAWDSAIAQTSGVDFHVIDGNHADLTGSFLTALIFYEIITGESADTLPYIASIDINESIQDLLGQIASQIILENPPCSY